MPQGDEDRNGQISVQKWPQRSPKVKSAMALYQKIQESYLCGKFHAFMKKCMIWLIMGAIYAAILNHMFTETAMVSCVHTSTELGVTH